MNQTMERLGKMKSDEYSALIRVLFGLTTPSPVSEDLADVEWLDPSLNDSQKDAIKFALASREYVFAWSRNILSKLVMRQKVHVSDISRYSGSRAHCLMIN